MMICTFCRKAALRRVFHPAVLSFLLLSFPVTSFSQESRDEHMQEDTLSAAVVTAHEILSATQTGLERLDKDRITGGFALLSTPDVIKVIQNLPGVASGTELMSGLFSSFNSDVVDCVDFYKSGFPGRYGGRLSSVVDVKTRDGDFDGYHGTFAIGLIDGRLQFEGPVVRDRLSFNAAVRRSWLDLLSVPGFAIYNKGREDRKRAGYSFSDANASLAWKVSENNRLSARFYMGRDALTLYESSKEKAYGKDAIHIGFDETAGHVSWGNMLASVVWDGTAGSRTDYNVTAYCSGSASGIRTDVSNWSWDDDAGDITTSAVETNRSRTVDLGLKANVSYIPHENHHLRMGVKCGMLFLVLRLTGSCLFRAMLPRTDWQ